MPFVQKTTSLTFPVIYNVEQAVGLQSPNRTGDVRLVQYMLKHYYMAADLKVDGWIGPTTNGYIQKFQTKMKDAGNKILADGRVDRAFGKESTVSKTYYTIVFLNLVLKKWNPAAWNDLPKQVPMNPNPVANPYNPAPSAPTVGIMQQGWKITVTEKATDSGVQYTEQWDGATQYTVIYTLPYFT